MCVPEGFNKFNCCSGINFIPKVIIRVGVFKFMYQVFVAWTNRGQCFKINEFMSPPLKQSAAILEIFKIILKHIFGGGFIFIIAGNIR